MWFVFRRSRKTNHISPSRERSEREMQKTLLGYAHPSVINFRLMLMTRRVKMFIIMCVFETIHKI
ncbi:MAG: hypothetical protein U5L45_25820 [Saprospiraceae bacterium]|nr:hypothetical protein [Saprospiraceae bacterium]